MRQCATCGKGSKMVGTRVLLRGHYNPTNWTRKYPNLQKHKLPSGKPGLMCTNCIKTLVKTAWVKAPSAKGKAKEAAKVAAATAK